MWQWLVEERRGCGWEDFGPEHTDEQTAMQWLNGAILPPGCRLRIGGPTITTVARVDVLGFESLHGSQAQAHDHLPAGERL